MTKCTRAIPIIAVLGALTIAWAAGGVSAIAALKAAGYEMVFVILPGVALFASLDRRKRSPLATFALGWALGYALEVTAFCITAAAGARAWLSAYPLLILALSAALYASRNRSISVRHTSPTVSPASFRWWLALGGGCALSVAYFAVAAFPSFPLPSRVPSVSYGGDAVFDVALTAEVAHHWPPTLPWISGLHLNYEWLVFAHFAAMSQVTNLQPAQVVFQMAPILMLICAFLLTFVVGSTLFRSARVGVVGACMVFLLGELDLLTSVEVPFLGTFHLDLVESPTFLFGLVFFLAAVTLLWEQITLPKSWSGWLLLAPILVIGGGAKGTLLPSLLGGLIVLAVWSWRHASQSRRHLFGGIALVSAAFVIDSYALYRGTEGALHIVPFDILTHSDFWASVVSGSPTLLHPLFWVLALLALLAPLAGALVIGGRDRPPALAFLFSLFAFGFIVLNVLEANGESELYFFLYGYVAGVIASAWGVVTLWERLAHVPSLRRRLATVVGTGTAVLVAPIVLVNHLDVPPGDKYAVAYGGFAFVAGLSILTARYMGHPVGVGRRAMSFAAVGIVLGGSFLDPAVEVWGTVHDLLYGLPTYSADSPLTRGLTRDLLDGMLWIRHHTSLDEVIAVNNHYRAPGDARYLYYSAFTERRVFFESWGDTLRENELTETQIDAGVQPFPKRSRLNKAVFDKADPCAAKTLYDKYGVRLLVVDRLHVPTAAPLARLGPLIYSNPDIAIYALSSLARVSCRG